MHDVFSQRLAVLGMEIGQLQQQAPSEAQDLQAKLESVQEEITQLSSAAHGVSRQFHPAILDDLGLAAALRNESSVFSKQHGIRARFRSRNVPRSAPEDVSPRLCRVARESLLNVGKHCGGDRVQVSLTAANREIVLRVVDVGDGFDLKQVKGKGGLGLVSMEERLRLLGGSLSVESQPGVGTKVEARVPTDRQGRQAMSKEGASERARAQRTALDPATLRVTGHA